MPVVAAALTRADGRCLLQQRPVHKRHGGLWEFPGGKVEVTENPREALCRELAEELAVAVLPEHCEPLLLADEAGEGPVVLMLYRIAVWQGVPESQEGCELRWIRQDEATEMPLAPMDRDFLSRISG